jgi:hypothetical protein
VIIVIVALVRVDVGEARALAGVVNVAKVSAVMAHSEKTLTPDVLSHARIAASFTCGGAKGSTTCFVNSEAIPPYALGFPTLLSSYIPAVSMPPMCDDGSISNTRCLCGSLVVYPGGREEIMLTPAIL